MKAGDYPDVIHLATGREAALTETFIKDNGHSGTLPMCWT
jgi:N-acetylglucosamine transport system substrate-binding protein